MNFTKTFLALMLFISTSVVCNAQSPEKKAQRFADEVAEVLSLNSDEAKKVYEIQLVRFKETKKINQNYTKGTDEYKQMRKKLGNNTYREMKSFLGQERIKQWTKYKKSKK